MNPADLIIIAIVLAVVALGARRIIETATGRRSCCSGDAKSSARRFRDVKIVDTDESHYPYKADFTVAGMTCDHCARNVTAALDSIAGTWATVDLESRQAHVLSKNPIDVDSSRDVVSEAGYRIIA